MEGKSKLIQVGIVQNKDGIRELFLLGHNLIAFNASRSNFDIIGIRTSSAIAEDKILSNKETHQICIDALAAVQPMEEDAMLLYHKGGSDSSILYGYVDGRSYMITYDSKFARSDFNPFVSIEEELDLCSCKAYFSGKHQISIEDSVLVEDYKNIL